jgi:carbamoyltransferase
MQVKPEYILGLSYHGNHESAAALLKDGELIAAAEEERFSRVKYDRSFPTRAIAFCLKEAGITADDLEHVGFFWQPWRGIGRRIGYALAGLPYSLSRGSRNAGVLFDLLSAQRIFRSATGYRGAFHFIEHHLTHAASVFYSSGFDEAAILTLDGTGEEASCWIGDGNGTTLTRFQHTLWPHSLGHLYATATQYLGFKKFADEYKVMGLAAYGAPRYLDMFRNIITVSPEGTFAIDLHYVDYQYFKERWYSDLWLRTFGPARSPGEELEERHKDIAASLQARLEEVVTELAAYALRRSGKKRLCLSGGVALNAVAVGALAESGVADAVYTNPVSGDAGCALGAAYFMHHCLLAHTARHPLPHAFWGEAFSDDEIEAILTKEHVSYEKLTDPAGTAAQLLANGHIIGWFQGRAEYGQRALGHRSILADPRHAATKEKINALVKHRESFRPFAPAILAEFQQEYFDWGAPVPFMTEVHPVREAQQERIPAVVHVDGTARLQTVQKETNPLFWELISHFHELTGVPVVLNTSFNMAGEPMVNSPEDALRTFQNSTLDALCIGHFLLKKQIREMQE